MDFSQKSTLEHIALIRITAALWNKHDIKFLLNEFLSSPLFLQMDIQFLYVQSSLGEREEKWKTIENRVKENVPQLMMPTKLKEKILSLIEPIGLQILRWMEYHHKSCGFDIDLPNEFYWTPHGTIDKKETASVLMNDESINVTIRYKLACIYCLENDIRRLRLVLPENSKKFYEERNYSRPYEGQLVVFWTYLFKAGVARVNTMNEENERSSFSHYAFKCAADGGNIEATKYFFQKLSSSKESFGKFLVETALSVAKKRLEGGSNCNSNGTAKEYHTDVLCFLLSQMNEEQQIEVFKSQPFHVLQCFLDWPWQNFFLETARRFWNFLPGTVYCNRLLRLIYEKVINGCMDCNYQEMFGKLWQQILITDKSSLINDSTFVGLISLLLQNKDEENFKLIFKTASLTAKKNLIFSGRARFICEDMIHFDEWDLLKFFIEVCISSKDEAVKFKEEFQEHILHNSSHMDRFRNDEKLDVFYSLLDDFVCRFEKRKSSDGDGNSPAKKLCMN